MRLRRLAKGRPCQVRLPQICNGDPATTVLAHYRMLPFNGTGVKPPDYMGAWCCSACHDAVDRRAKHDLLHYGELRLAHAEGVLRTLAELVKLGQVKL